MEFDPFKPVNFVQLLNEYAPNEVVALGMVTLVISPKL